jgi:hypothetical protein
LAPASTIASTMLKSTALTVICGGGALVARMNG